MIYRVPGTVKEFRVNEAAGVKRGGGGVERGGGGMQVCEQLVLQVPSQVSGGGALEEP